MSDKPKLTVLGAGSWGTALAVHLAASGRPVNLWARDASLVAEMTAARTNARRLSAAEPRYGLPR